MVALDLVEVRGSMVVRPPDRTRPALPKKFVRQPSSSLRSRLAMGSRILTTPAWVKKDSGSNSTWWQEAIDGEGHSDYDHSGSSLKDGSACNESPVLEDSEQPVGLDSSGCLVCSGPACCHALQPRNCITQWPQHREVVGCLFRRPGTDQRGLGCQHKCFRLHRLSS